jgi:squalene-associated FAD-dependent desaturase
MTPRVVVVGGGLAGLSAGIGCADAGAEVTLLEARTRLGGATFSFRRGGLWIDNGQHVFLRCCSAYRAFLRRIGTEADTALQDRLAIPVMDEEGRRAVLRRSNLPAPLHLATALASYPFLSPVERARTVPAALALARMDPDAPALDDRSFGDWLEQRGQSAAAIEALWNFFALPTLNIAAGQASLALAVKVFRTGLLSSRDGADVGYATVPLSRLHGDAGAAALKRAGATIRLRTAVRALRVGSANGRSTLEVASDGRTWEADAVILAVPHDDAAGLLPPGAIASPERLGALGASPIVNAHVVFDRRVMSEAFVAGVRTPVQWVFDRTNPSGLESGQYLAISISGADVEIDERTEVLRDRLLPALGRLFPRAREARVERFFVTREHAATFRQAPGTNALRPSTRTAIPGLSLAGAWTDTGWPATMEGAVRSGVLAAREAMAHAARARPARAEAAA